MKRKIVMILAATLCLGLFVACTEYGKIPDKTPYPPMPSSTPTPEPTAIEPSSEDNPVITITLEDGRIMTAELYPDVAPNTVNNFISLIKSGFYDGLTFHRAEPGFVIQGGDPQINGATPLDYSIKGEFSENGFDNPLKHTKGVLSMARSTEDSANSQFFIMVGDSPGLDNKYASFGKILTGQEVADDISLMDTTENMGLMFLDEPVVIKSITVDTKGVEYPEPEKVQ